MSQPLFPQGIVYLGCLTDLENFLTIFSQAYFRITCNKHATALLQLGPAPRLLESPVPYSVPFNFK